MSLPAPPDSVERSMKEALVKAGLISASDNKRGRPSRQYIEWTEGLVAQGWNIKGYSTSTAPAGTEDKPKVERVKRDPNAVIDVPDQLRDETLWKAVAVNSEGNAVDVGMKKVCNLCGNSLTYCAHPQPVVWVDYNLEAVVDFRPIKQKG